jgi:hypothetical protein
MPMLFRMQGEIFFLTKRRGTVSHLIGIGKVTMVIINSIGREAFHQLLPTNIVPEIAVGEEVEWFADVAETIVGTIGLGGMNVGWNYAILERDTQGDFRVSEKQRNFPTRHTTRVMLLRRMVGAEAAEAWRHAA